MADDSFWRAPPRGWYI